ncbi:MAG TPA: murein L,D-transpeptidase [Nocardioides sp.]|nr:murein L,D-transpeptidase [Nocardioides sp.]
MLRRLLAPAAVTLLTTALLLLPQAPAAAGTAFAEKAQRRLNALHCNAGPVDGEIGAWTRSAVIRFQTRHRLAQSGRLTRATRRQLFADDARRCDRRPVPGGSGTGRRVVISQQQNWVWLVGPRGGVQAQGGMIDLPSELSRGWHATGSYCGRAARIQRNTTTSGAVWLENFVRFAPCGIGFHRIPTYQSNGHQIHPDWYLGTNYAQSHGCIRLSRWLSGKLWDFTTSRTRVRVV